MHYLRIRPNVQPGKLGRDTFSISGFRSGTDIYFVIPPQAVDLYCASISGTYVIIDEENHIIRGAYTNAISIDPKVGHFGLFSSTRVERAFQSNVIENWTQNPLTISFLSRTEHDASSFISNSGGNGVFPFFTDKSVNKTFGGILERPIQNGVLSYNYDPTGDGYVQVCQRPFWYTPCMGLMVNGTPKNLASLGGLQFCFTVARFGDIGNQDLPTPEEDQASIFTNSQGDPLKCHSVAYQALKSSRNLSIGIIDPVMDILIQPESGGATLSIQFNSIDVNRSQTTPSQNQHYTAPFGSVLVKSLYYFLLYKPNTTVGHISSLMTSAIRKTDWSLYINGKRQIYAFPTNTVDPSLSISNYTPNAFINNILTTPSRFQTLDQIWNGAFQIFDYNLDGIGVLFENVNVTFQALFLDLASTPNVFTFAEEHVGAPMINGSKFTEMNCIATYWYHDEDYNKNDLFNTYNATSRKFTQRLNVSNQTDIVTATLNTKTLVINPTAATIIPSGVGPKKIPKFLQLQTAAPPSSVNRTLEFLVQGQKMNTSLAGTVAYEFLLPDSGRLGNMFLFYSMKPVGSGELFQGVASRVFDQSCSVGGSNPQVLQLPGTTINTIAQALFPAFTPGTSPGNVYGTFTSWPNKKNAGNVNFNRCGYGAVLGSTSLISAVDWLLPGGVTLQRYNLQSNKFLNHFGDKHTDDLAEYEFTTHVTSGYFYDERYDGKLRDLVVSREQNRAYDSWNSVFQFSSNNRFLSDMQPDVTYRQCTNLIDVDSSFKQMIGTCLTTTQKRYLRIYFDTTASAIANVSAGEGHGWYTEGNTKKAIYSTAPLSIDDDQDPASVVYMMQGMRIGRPPLSVLGTYIDEDIPVILNIQCIFDDPVTTSALVDQFKANGVTMTMTQFDFQRRFYDSWEPEYNDISRNTELPIGGRNPKLITMSHKYLMTKEGFLTPRTVYPSGTNILPNQQAGLENYFVSYYNDELLHVPLYIACRDGPIGYSVPRNTVTSGLSLDLGLSQITPLVDNTVMYTFPLGDSATNSYMYAIAFGTPLQLPHHNVSVCADRVVNVYQERFPYWENTNEVEWVFGNVEFVPWAINYPFFLQATNNWSPSWEDGLNSGDQTGFQPYFHQQSFLDYDNCPLNPTRYVTCLPFLPEHENGNILMLSDNKGKIEHNFTGYNASASLKSVLSNPLFNNQQPAEEEPVIMDCWAINNAMTQARYLMCEYGILEGIQLFFNNERAEVRYLYPTGQIIV